METERDNEIDRERQKETEIYTGRYREIHRQRESETDRDISRQI